MIAILFLTGLAFGQERINTPTVITWDELVTDICWEARKPEQLAGVVYTAGELHLQMGKMLASYHHELTGLYMEAQRNENPELAHQAIQLSAVIADVLPNLLLERERLRDGGLIFKSNVGPLRNGRMTKLFSEVKPKKKQEVYAACKWIMGINRDSLTYAYSVWLNAQVRVNIEEQAFRDAQEKAKNTTTPAP